MVDGFLTRPHFGEPTNRTLNYVNCDVMLFHSQIYTKNLTSNAHSSWDWVGFVGFLKFIFLTTWIISVVKTGREFSNKLKGLKYQSIEAASSLSNQTLIELLGIKGSSSNRNRITMDNSNMFNRELKPNLITLTFGETLHLRTHTHAHTEHMWVKDQYALQQWQNRNSFPLFTFVDVSSGWSKLYQPVWCFFGQLIRKDSWTSNKSETLDASFSRNVRMCTVGMKKRPN